MSFITCREDIQYIVYMSLKALWKNSIAHFDIGIMNLPPPPPLMGAGVKGGKLDGPRQSPRSPTQLSQLENIVWAAMKEQAA